MIPNTFTILFTQTLDYEANDLSELKQFQKTIYSNFCLLSWLIPDYHIRVMHQIVLDQAMRIKIFRKGYTDREFYILERRKDNFIYYSIDEYTANDKQEFIERAANIPRTNESIYAELGTGTLDSFTITICCKETVKGGLSFSEVFTQPKNKQDTFNYFKPPSKKTNHLKASRLDIEYYYIQPESRRFCEPQGYHLSLAFQGGGVKGVSYVGVKKAIDNLRNRILIESGNKIDLQIKSFLGSSAGGLLSLPISVGIEHEDFIDICLMMNSLSEDILIKQQNITPQALKLISQQYSQNIEAEIFAQQQIAIKNWLHNLGLVQDSLSDIIFETLKQPSVQDKISTLLWQINPSIAAYLSYKQPYERGQGESINNCMGSCCCCLYKESCCYSPCCRTTPCSDCFITQSNQYKKINVYGLLYAALMTGDTIENMMAYALAMFFQIQANKASQEICNFARKKKWFNSMDNAGIFKEIQRNASDLRKNFRRRQNSSDRRYLQNILIQYSRQITLEEYYHLNSVEFTCTYVDLDDKIERLFNHKTTPNLPVVKALLLTGSFPFAFLAHQWKKQWGKYYIHYDRTRREIDLTGHRFTDGGWLANFPLKYLDNQKFRQKYFSHKKVKGKTIIYGFGSQEMQDFPQNDRSQKIKQCMDSLSQEFKYRAVYKILMSLMKCGSTNTLQIKKVRLFQFWLSMVEALRSSDRNLNKECFKYEIIQTVVTKKPMHCNEVTKDTKASFANFIDWLDRSIHSHFDKNKREFLNDQFNAICQGIDKFAQMKQNNRKANEFFNKKLSWSQIQQIERKIQNNILIYSTKCLQTYQRRMQQLTKKYLNKDLFMTNPTMHHQYYILEILHQLKECMMNQPVNEFSSMKEMMLKNCDEYFLKFTTMYKQCLQSLDQQDGHQLRKALIKQKQIIDLLNTKYQLSPYVLALFNRINQISELQNSTPLINFYVEESTFLRKDKIKASIANQIMQKKAQFEWQNKKENKQARTRLHILFETSYFSHYYFMNYIKIVEEVIADKNIKIDIISCTSYHAIFGVFYLLGYDPNTVKRAMYEIQYLFEENEHIQQVYASKEWTKTSIEQMRTLLKREWQKQVDPFEIIQHSSGLIRQKNSQRLQIHSDVFNHIEMDQQYINSAFEKVIDYISFSFEEVATLSKEQRKDRFDQLLSLGKYKKINRNKSKVGERVINIFLQYTVDLMMLTAEHIFKSQQFVLFSSKKWSKETVFKGMVINSLINAYKYRIYIYDLLSRAGLDRNITLAKFHDVCQRKIVLNFNCTNTSQQRFQLINKITKPNMPLWAALMACASLPYLEGEFESFKQWDNREKGGTKVEMAEAFFCKFDHYSGNTQNSYISGNAISTLPIETITNERLIKSKLTQDQATNTIEIVFAFDSQFNKKIGNSLDDGTEDRQKCFNKEAQLTAFFSQLPQKMEGKRRFINCFDVICCLFGALCRSECEFGDYFGNVLSRIGTLKMLQTKFSAHDNLIINLYHDSLINLPIRIGTLEFFRVTRSRPDLTDAVTQAYQVVREVCDSVKVNPFDKGKLEFRTPSRTTIQVSRHKCDVYDKQRALWSPQQRFYRVKFISFTKWRNLKNKYLVQYSLNVEANALRHVEWVRLREDYADFPESVFEGNQYKLLLKFTYYQDRLVSRIYLLSMEALRELQLDPIRAIFSLDYRQVYSTAEPLQLYHQSDPIADIAVKSHFVPHDSRYCSNLQCSADKLEYVLMREEHRICYTCSGEYLLSGKSSEDFSLLFGEASSEPSLIAMRCLRCNKSYCLKCKISSFIVKKVTNAKEDTYHYECPKNEGRVKQVYELGKAPIAESCLGEGRGAAKNCCLFCGRYSSKLYYERDIIKGSYPRNEFGGLRICEMCILYHVK